LFATQYDLLFRNVQIPEDANPVKAKRRLVFWMGKQNNHLALVLVFQVCSDEFEAPEVERGEIPISNF